jgi:hypothetical protein
MAKYRSIHQKIWKDPHFELYSSESKLVFIYLCTNGSTSESGIYAITPKTISNETSTKQDEVVKMLKSLRNVMWDEKNNYVYVRRFRIYNGGGAPDNIKKAIVAEFLQSSSLSLWVNFVEDYPEFKEVILATGKPLIPPLPLNPNPVSISISNSISNSISIDGLPNPSPTVGQPLENEANLPSWIKKETWDAFLEMRRKIKKIPTEHAKKLLIKELEKLKNSGNEPNAVLNQSIMRNYTGVFPLDENRGGQYGTGTAPGRTERPYDSHQRAVAKAHTPEEYERSAENWRKRHAAEG